MSRSRAFLVPLFVPLFVLACSSSSSSNGTGGAGGDGGQAGESSGGDGGTSTASSSAGGSPGGAGGAPTGGVSSTGGSGKGGATYKTCAPAKDLGVRIVGRNDGCVADGVRVAWPGSGFVGSFDGTGVSVKLRELSQANQYAVLVDGVLLDQKLVTKAGEGTYSLATGLPQATHRIELYRRTEGSFGPTVFLEIPVEGGALSTAPAPKGRFIEVIGDSISCGYGNEGETSGCPFSADTENHYLSYGALLARHFDAELSTVAWSGKGVARNYDGEIAFPRMPEIYNRSIPTDTTVGWGFEPKPNLVVINLGTNDYSSDKDPTDSEFTSAYVGLLENIRSHYADAYILCTIGPMLSGTDLTTARKNIAAAVETRHTAGDPKVEAYELTTGNPSPGCSYHPDLTTHQAMATELATKISSYVGW
ncbi:MAG: SGNH/GDSL hydrolase family protein [Polyangiaceae bacterium]